MVMNITQLRLTNKLSRLVETCIDNGYTSADELIRAGFEYGFALSDRFYLHMRFMLDPSQINLN